MSISTDASLVTSLHWAIFWIAVLVFVVVQGLLIASTIRFYTRQRTEQPGMPRTMPLDLVWTVIPAMVGGAIFLVSFQTMTAAHTGNEVEYVSMEAMEAADELLPGLDNEGMLDILHADK